MGRHTGKINSPTVSRNQFLIESRISGYYYRNLSETSPAGFDGEVVAGDRKLSDGEIHVLQMGLVTAVLGPDYVSAKQYAAQLAVDLYMVNNDGEEQGPFTESQILENCESRVFSPSTKLWSLAEPDKVMEMSEVVDFSESEVTAEPPLPCTEQKRHVAGEETQVELGKSFMCPYCRTVADVEDVLSIASSPALHDDPVLGEGEQKRFLPTQFNANGLALDSEGGVCTEIACPRCHMALPQKLLETPQMVMSVIGAPSAGKSVFLASSMWQCRMLLSRMFGVGFTDLDPVANRWINAYEEKLFFQEDDQTLQQIEKTEVLSANVCRSVNLDGNNVYLPLPSFFLIRSKSDPQPKSLVVYDSAGEHFRAGADMQSSAVTLNMLNADVLFFMFDPSADPRLRPLLDRGSGTAINHAQRQDVLLAEMAARIRRHLGNRSEDHLSRPLIFGVSKADLLRNYLPLDAEIYKQIDGGKYALDLDALRKVSDATEALLDDVTPEVTATAHDIAQDVWFMPVSALGHNPMRDGVRPCDIKPLWTELPIVFTLACKGLIPVLGGN